MKPLHARYPFLSSAREAVDRAGVDLAVLVAEDDRVVERAVERVTLAVEEGSVGEPRRETRIELLSYPVARVLVSLADEPVLVRRYAGAEAAAAHDRLGEDLVTGDDGLRSVSTDRLELEDLLAEFDLAADVDEVEDGYRVALPAYLAGAAGIRGDRWRLVNRRVVDGRVAVDHGELLELLRQAIRERVADGLPLPVPEAVATPLEEPVAEVQSTLAELDLTRDIDAVVPELFPPCMKHLLEQVQAGAHLEHHSRFAITAFLANIGLTTDEIVDLYMVNPGFGEEMTRYQTDHIRGETSPTEYDPPSCATLKSYGDCVNMDDLCDRIAHPMAYYEAKLDDTDEDELDDWRDREEAEAE